MSRPSGNSSYTGQAAMQDREGAAQDGAEDLWEEHNRARARQAAMQRTLPFLQPSDAVAGQKRSMPAAAPGDLGTHHGGDFGVYMNHKKRKLDLQFASDMNAASSSSSSSAPAADTSSAAKGTGAGGFFSGVNVYFNGVVEPLPADVLALMIRERGGAHSLYLTSAITHVVAPDLPDQKIKEILKLKRQSQWLKVVRPEWVVDCVESNRLLDTAPYLLPEFKTGGSSSSSSSSSSSGLSFLKAQPRAQAKQQPAVAIHQGKRPVALFAAPKPADAPPPAVHSSSASSSSSSSSASSLSALPPARSSGSDPLFMEGYFSSSRLHFIGSFKRHVQTLVALAQNGKLPMEGVADRMRVVAEPIPGFQHGKGGDSNNKKSEDKRPRSSGAEDEDDEDDGDEDEDEDDAQLGLQSDQHHSYSSDEHDHSNGTLSSVIASSSSSSSSASSSSSSAALATASWPRVIVHSDIDCFFAQVSLLDKPEAMKLRPVVVAHEGARPGGVGMYRPGGASALGTGGALGVFGDGMDTAASAGAGAGASLVEDGGEAHGESGDEDASSSYFFGAAQQPQQPPQSKPAAAKPPPWPKPGSAQGGHGSKLKFATTTNGDDEDNAVEGEAASASVASYSGGEVSSANYPARRYGIHAGMAVNTARELCPKDDPLIILPYNFERIREVSETVFKCFLCLTLRVQAGSCDEAYLDLSGLRFYALGDEEEDGGDGRKSSKSKRRRPIGAEEAVSLLREDVFRLTGCTISAGLSYNMLLARLCTSKAKPNGMYSLPPNPALVQSFLAGLGVDALPGVGWSHAHLLTQEKGVKTVADVQRLPLATLVSWLGESLGRRVYDCSRGKDEGRQVTVMQARKSIGAECNWGIRFTEQAQVTAFLRKLCEEVARRMAVATCEDAAAAGIDLGAIVNNNNADKDDTSPANKEKPASSSTAAAAVAAPSAKVDNNDSARLLSFLHVPDASSIPSRYAIKGRKVTLKLMVRRRGAGMPFKGLGHGECDSFSRTADLAATAASAGASNSGASSSSLSSGATCDANVIFKAVSRLYSEFNCDPTQVRGLGISISRLHHPLLEGGGGPQQHILQADEEGAKGQQGRLSVSMLPAKRELQRPSENLSNDAHGDAAAAPLRPATEKRQTGLDVLESRGPSPAKPSASASAWRPHAAGGTAAIVAKRARERAGGVQGHIKKFFKPAATAMAKEASDSRSSFASSATNYDSDGDDNASPVVVSPADVMVVEADDDDGEGSEDNKTGLSGKGRRVRFEGLNTASQVGDDDDSGEAAVVDLSHEDDHDDDDDGDGGSNEAACDAAITVRDDDGADKAAATTRQPRRAAGGKDGHLIQRSRTSFARAARGSNATARPPADGSSDGDAAHDDNDHGASPVVVSDEEQEQSADEGAGEHEDASVVIDDVEPSGLAGMHAASSSSAASLDSSKGSAGWGSLARAGNSRSSSNSAIGSVGSSRGKAGSSSRGPTSFAGAFPKPATAAPAVSATAMLPRRQPSVVVLDDEDDGDDNGEGEVGDGRNTRERLHDGSGSASLDGASPAAAPTVELQLAIGATEGPQGMLAAVGAWLDTFSGLPPSAVTSRLLCTAVAQCLRDGRADDACLLIKLLERRCKALDTATALVAHGIAGSWSDVLTQVKLEAQRTAKEYLGVTLAAALPA